MNLGLLVSILHKAAIALAVILLPIVAIVPGKPASAVIYSPEELEVQFVDDINQLRRDQGLAPLVVNARLTQLSREHSSDMARQGVLSHNLRSITDSVPSTWVKLGQNVGYGSRQSKLHAAFVASRSHYVNLVDNFTSVGIGVVSIDGRIWVTENFMR